MMGTISDLTKGLGFRKTITRISWLFKRLTGSSRPFTARMLAEEYECCTRSINRDIDTLKDMGAIETRMVYDDMIRTHCRVIVSTHCPMCGAHWKGEG